MAMTLSGDNGVTFNDSSLQGAAASPYVLKNRLINSAMVIDQRNAGASVSANGRLWVTDRWIIYASASGKFTGQQNAGSVTPPAGFTNYLGITSSSSYTPTSGQVFTLAEQRIEGYNIADFAWGTASAKTITLSFWVRSSLTGTFSGALNHSSFTRNYIFTYTISSANTWEYKTITITGDTSGTLNTTNGNGLCISFNAGSGSDWTSSTTNTWQNGEYYGTPSSVSVIGTNGATWYITGVQLEVGSSATPFERRLYNQELVNCQRYYEQTVLGNMQIPNGSGSAMINPISFHVTKRVQPTMATITAATLNGAGSTGLNGVSVDGFGLQFVNSSGTNNYFTNSPVYSASAEL